MNHATPTNPTQALLIENPFKRRLLLDQSSVLELSMSPDISTGAVKLEASKSGSSGIGSSKRSQEKITNDSKTTLLPIPIQSSKEFLVITHKPLDDFIMAASHRRNEKGSPI